VRCALTMTGVVLALFAREAAAADAAQLTRGWSTLRVMDCARCHGRDYEGWTAPSLIAAVRDGPRERFERYVLDGDSVRGMPAYRSQAVVVDNLDAMYAYLIARAKGELGRGNPAAAPDAKPAAPPAEMPVAPPAEMPAAPPR